MRSTSRARRSSRPGRRDLSGLAGPLSIKSLNRALPTLAPERIAEWLDAGSAGQGGPVARAAMVVEGALRDAPRAEAPALILADAALAQSLGWDHMVPLLAAGLKRADLRKSGEELYLACHRALVVGADEALRLADELARRAAQLRVSVLIKRFFGPICD